MGALYVPVIFEQQRRDHNRVSRAPLSVLVLSGASASESDLFYHATANPIAAGKSVSASNTKCG